MSTYTSFAVAGAGNVGIPIVKALLERGARVLVLTRSSSSNPKALSEHPNLKVASVEYTDRAGLSTLLRDHKVEVFVSAVSYLGGALDAQRPLADAAKDADIKLFVPSEFGVPSEGATEGVSSVKARFAAYLKSLGIPSLRLYNGLFQEYIPWVGIVPETGKFHILGKGETPVSFTSVPDVAGFLAHVLTTQSPTKLADVQLRIEGQRVSLNDIVRLYGGTVPAVYVDSIPGTDPVRAFLQGEFERGAGSTGWDPKLEKDNDQLAGSANGLWDGHEWATVKETLKL
ncbi:NAD(P)-binding protein [Leucogyrophana mollusca]|uniref:NAD(P)-binding protein n=1 Tax=Leucogyrophana mollusca TaxID=85980 RepID=A0ACB8B7K7_9AGAM|nr:NAD(P)-binding protein [Leucogyrophana mollusca]